MSIRIALAGNPNSGKTTLFNALTGSNQFVGNWPGVTVEKKEGGLIGNKEVLIVDLPGVYSLSPYTLEEVITRNYLIEERPDVILNIVDCTNIERNLYLTTQLTELGIPVVIALNMMDVVFKNGDIVNSKNLSNELGCKVAEISALKSTGVFEAAEIAINEAKTGKTVPMHRFSAGVEHTLAHIEESALRDSNEILQRWYATKLFERDNEMFEKLKISVEKISYIEGEISKCEKELDDDSEGIIASERYTYVETVIKNSYKSNTVGKMSTSEKIDKIVTNRILALPIFAAAIFLIYYVSVSTVGAFATEWANDGVFGEGWNLFGLWIPGIPVLVGDFLVSINCVEWLQRLIRDGIIGGVGAVLGFVPQLLILFIFLAFLESCGYMARIAFILDRVFRKFGLSGKSFIPILIGTGCGVPAIMAARTIESDRDRKMTIMTATFIPCGAKLPIIALISGAMFGGAWWVAPSAYFVGIAAIICSGVILKKTKTFAGNTSPFVMELPDYHMPTVGSVLRSMWERGWSFIKKAGTVILLSTVFIWFTSSFGFIDGSFGMVEMNDSLLASLGRAISWIFIPLGWTGWESTVASLTGLIAKENVVGTFGVLFGFAEVAEDGAEIWGTLAASFTMASAYSFLIFNLLCAPCFAAMGAIRREMNNPRWFWIAIGYQTILAYLAAMSVYQIWMLIASGKFDVFTVFAILTVVVFLWLLFRKPRSVSYKNKLVSAVAKI